MERLILNLQDTLYLLRLYIAKIQVIMHDKENNPYAIFSEISIFKIRLSLIKKLLTGVEFPKSVGTDIKHKIKDLDKYIKDLEESIIGK